MHSGFTLCFLNGGLLEIVCSDYIKKVHLSLLYIFKVYILNISINLTILCSFYNHLRY